MSALAQASPGLVATRATTRGCAASSTASTPSSSSSPRWWWSTRSARSRSAAAQAFTWLVVLFVAFFMPSALVSAELGAAIPEEGGAYVWVRQGVRPVRRRADVAALLGGHADVARRLGHGRRHRGVRAVRRRPRHRRDATSSAPCSSVPPRSAAVVPLRFGKWVPTSGAIGQIVLLGVLHGHGRRSTGSSTASTASPSATWLRPSGGVHRRRAGAALLVRRHRAAVRRRGGDGAIRGATSRSPSRAPASPRR